MATITGNKAKVMLDIDGTSVQVMELREWSISASTEKIDTSVAGKKSTSHLPGKESWEGEATCISADQYWLKYLSEMVTIEFYIDGDSASAAYSGTASLDFEVSSPHDDVVETSLTFTGSGDLTSPAEAAQTP